MDYLTRVIGQVTGTLPGDKQRSNRRRIQPVVTKVSDPAGLIISAADRLNQIDGHRPSTGWMRRAASGARSPVESHRSGRTVYDGRACCYEHLKKFEGRPDMVLPLTTTCPECQAEYRIDWGMATVSR